MLPVYTAHCMRLRSKHFDFSYLQRKFFVYFTRFSNFYNIYYLKQLKKIIEIVCHLKTIYLKNLKKVTPLSLQDEFVHHQILNSSIYAMIHEYSRPCALEIPVPVSFFREYFQFTFFFSCRDIQKGQKNNGRYRPTETAEG